MAAVLLFTLVGSYISSPGPQPCHGNASVFLTMLLALNSCEAGSHDQRRAGVQKPHGKTVQSIVSGIVVRFYLRFYRRRRRYDDAAS